MIPLFTTPNVLIHGFSFCFSYIQFVRNDIYDPSDFQHSAPSFPNDHFFMFIPVSNTSPLSIQLSILGLSRIFLLKQEHSALAVHLSYITCFSSSSTLSSHLFQIYLSSNLFQLTPCKDSFLKSIVNQRSLSRFSFLFLEIVAAFMFLLFLLHFLFCASLCKANIQLPSSYTVF